MHGIPNEDNKLSQSCVFFFKGVLLEPVSCQLHQSFRILLFLCNNDNSSYISNEDLLQDWGAKAKK